MGIVPSNIASAYKEATPKTGGKQLDAGTHDATIVKVEIETDKSKIRAPWIDAELVVTFEGDEGGKAWKRMELAPLTDQQGAPSAGKLGFLKGQLQNMGYTGELDRLEHDILMIQGAKVRISIEDKASNKINPKTNKPYVNREVYANELLVAGAGGSSSSDDFVPIESGDDDDDIPF